MSAAHQNRHAWYILSTMEPHKILNDDRSKTSRAAAYQLVNVYAMKMAAVCMISASTVEIRTRIFQRWMAMLGYALAMLMLLSTVFHYSGCCWFSRFGCF